MDNKLIEFLQQVNIFNDVPSEAIRKLVSLGEIVHFKGGDTIIREGDMGEEMYVICDGSVRITKNITLSSSAEDEGIEKDLIVLKRGDHAIFGEMGLLEKDERTATVAAVSDVELLKIGSSAFEKFSIDEPASAYSILRNIAQIISGRLRKANKDVIKLTTVLGIVLAREKTGG